LLTEEHEVERGALQSLEEAFKDATSEPEGLGNHSQDGLSASVASMNKAAQFLHQILAHLDPSKCNSSPLLTLDASSFDLIFNETKTALDQIATQQENSAAAGKGILTKGFQKLCAYVGPFVKIFLTVGVQGSAVPATPSHR
jgi:hypothetical protein